MRGKHLKFANISDEIFIRVLISNYCDLVRCGPVLRFPSSPPQHAYTTLDELSKQSYIVCDVVILCTNSA